MDDKCTIMGDISDIDVREVYLLTCDKGHRYIQPGSHYVLRRRLKTAVRKQYLLEGKKYILLDLSPELVFAKSWR